MVIGHSVFLKISSVSDKRCRETQNTSLMFINFFLKIMLFVRCRIML
jgi:hypothetical protein